MERPLIDSHRNSPGGNNQSAGRESSPNALSIDRRGKAFKTGSKVQQAAALVDIAYDGEGLPESFLDSPHFSEKADYYLFYNAAGPLWLATYAALLLLNFVEIPSWCLTRHEHSCGDPKEYWLGDVPYLPPTVFLIVELVLFVLLAAHVLFPLLYAGPKLYKESPKDAISTGLLLLLGLDIVRQMLFVWTDFPVVELESVRLAPYLRVLIFLVSVKEVRDNLWTVVTIVPNFMDIFILGFVYVAFSSWLAYVLFEDTLQGKEEFTTFSITSLKMVILFTGSNNPDVWQKAYEEHRAYSIFFVVYLLLGLYFLTNLVLAVIFDSFQKQLGQARKAKEANKRRVLSRAFAFVDGDNRGYIDSDQLTGLMHALNLYRAVPHIEKDDMRHIFLALDDSGDYKIQEDEFSDLCDAIGTKFIKLDEPPFLKIVAPGIFNSRAFTAVRDFVKDPRFDRYVMTSILLANLVTVAIETALDMRNLPSQALWQDIEYVFGWIYVLEALLKVSVLGFSNYWRETANRFDFFITWTILIGQTALILDPNQTVANKEWIRYLLIGRMLRLLRLLTYVERYRAIVKTFLKLIPAMGPLFGVLFGFVSLFNSLGIHLFGGLVYESNPLLKSTPLSDHKPYNFNDYSTGMVTLFNLLSEADWQDWMEGYAILGHRALAARTFFLAFMCLGTGLVMNVFVSFVMEAFTVEMETETEAEKAASRSGDGLNLSAERHGANVRPQMSNSDRLMDKMFGEGDGDGDKESGDQGV
ncbi:hypothetical protein KFL_003120080 [Klebsormidium nitens]|uniref:EF-hand domain-containing protein n=1 Tax=Klebsormidium nitens TaxID=105231 RepID=A0A1Y1ICK0_KLENI|nr:hypothetical protein KFL_003120080 [Klebsormidium nitens]|eukprot:GAQ86801.1 hypothetical protein KFL_003120080 [Klebsormidium nitens]